MMSVTAVDAREAKAGQRLLGIRTVNIDNGQAGVLIEGVNTRADRDDPDLQVTEVTVWVGREMITLTMDPATRVLVSE